MDVRRFYSARTVGPFSLSRAKRSVVGLLLQSPLRQQTLLVATDRILYRAMRNARFDAFVLMSQIWFETFSEAGEPRMVICSMCLHVWRAFEKEIIWGEDAAIKSIKDAPERPLRRRPRSRRASRDENAMSVFVGGLAYSCTEDDLFAAFCAFGEISRCQIPQKAGTPRGIGFVEFRNKDDAIRAIETLDGASILGRKISLSVANVDTNKELEDDERLDAATKRS
mmetsp:Transcript_4913/g.21125  ORF Transcript_4913/g.21125 Transcript_4913/m.21125 type:complete len:225 (-) Transcript_4913:1530-2204(-)